MDGQSIWAVLPKLDPASFSQSWLESAFVLAAAFDQWQEMKCLPVKRAASNNVSVELLLENDIFAWFAAKPDSKFCKKVSAPRNIPHGAM